eukprot:TRINITY_DN3883_c0_g1_i2.p1 TRINITY_DN3883_c0_g1~~TRINITY_DN3883_c0_g1_i2.p1  ORF type:complete len:615 (-),score=166.66 TRINITY_DN3883_c0_g1_i2:244-2088(-)
MAQKKQAVREQTQVRVDELLAQAKRKNETQDEDKDDVSHKAAESAMAKAEALVDEMKHDRKEASQIKQADARKAATIGKAEAMVGEMQKRREAKTKAVEAAMVRQEEAVSESASQILAGLRGQRDREKVTTKLTAEEEAEAARTKARVDELIAAERERVIAKGSSAPAETGKSDAMAADPKQSDQAHVQSRVDEMIATERARKSNMSAADPTDVMACKPEAMAVEDRAKTRVDEMMAAEKVRKQTEKAVKELWQQPTTRSTEKLEPRLPSVSASTASSALAAGSLSQDSFGSGTDMMRRVEQEYQRSRRQVPNKKSGFSEPVEEAQEEAWLEKQRKIEETRRTRDHAEWDALHQQLSQPVHDHDAGPTRAVNQTAQPGATRKVGFSKKESMERLMSTDKNKLFLGGRDPLALARSLSDKKFIPSCLMEHFLYIGGVQGAREQFRGKMESTLGFQQFSHVVSLLNPGQRTPYPCESVLQIGVRDDPTNNLVTHWDDIIRWIGEAKDSTADARVLVHCVQGSSRSGSTAVAYVMTVNKWTLAQAMEHCKALHADLCPNKGFFMQLQEWEHHLLGRLKPSVTVKEARRKGWCGVSKFKEDIPDWNPQMPHLMIKGEK